MRNFLLQTIVLIYGVSAIIFFFQSHLLENIFSPVFLSLVLSVIISLLTYFFEKQSIVL